MPGFSNEIDAIPRLVRQTSQSRLKEFTGSSGNVVVLLISSRTNVLEDPDDTGRYMQFQDLHTCHHRTQFRT